MFAYMKELEKITEWLNKFSGQVERNGRLLETAFEVLEEIREDLRVFRNAIAHLDERMEVVESRVTHPLKSRIPGASKVSAGQL